MIWRSEQDRADDDAAMWGRIEERVQAERHYAGAVEQAARAYDCVFCRDYGYAWDTLYDGTPVMVACPECIDRGAPEPADQSLTTKETA